MKNVLYVLLIGLSLCLCSCVETEVDDKALLEEVKALFKEDKYAEALPLAERLVKICEEKYGTEHPDTVVAELELGWNYIKTKNYAKAESTLKKNLEACKRVFGLEHPRTIDCLDNMAELYHETGNWDKAMQFGQSVLELKEKVYGPDHYKTNIARSLLEKTQKAVREAQQQ